MEMRSLYRETRAKIDKWRHGHFTEKLELKQINAVPQQTSEAES